jgi:hypothetical protein
MGGEGCQQLPAIHHRNRAENAGTFAYASIMEKPTACLRRRTPEDRVALAMMISTLNIASVFFLLGR